MMLPEVCHLPGKSLFRVACPSMGNFFPKSSEKAETPLDDARALGILQPNIQQRCWMGSKRL